MSQSIGLLDLHVTSAGAITARRGVTFGGAQVAAAGGKPMGIAQHGATAAGQPVLLRVKGTAIAEAGAAVAVGDAVAMDAQGRVVPAAALTVAAGATAVTSSAANGAILAGGVPPVHVVGDALQAATAAGQPIEILLR
jgi:hypothetical protein